MVMTAQIVSLSLHYGFFFGLLQVKRSFGLCSLQLTYFDEENEEVRDFFFKHLLYLILS